MKRKSIYFIYITAMLIYGCWHERLASQNFQYILGEIEYRSGNNETYFGELKKIDAFAISESLNHSLLGYINIGTYLYKEDENGLNFGCGFRKAFENMAIGLNTYYDGQQSQSYLSQIGTGFEFFSNALSMFGNLYIPVGKQSFNNSYTVFDDYVGNYIVELRQKNVASKSFELNLCGEIFNEMVHLYPGIGLYYSTFNRCSSLKGFQASLRCELYGKFYIEPQFTYDNIFCERCNITIGMHYTFGQSKAASKLARQPFRRNGYIRSLRTCKYATNY